MENGKKNLTVKELREECEVARKAFEELSERLKKAEQDEENKRRSMLESERKAREKEVDEAIEKLHMLLDAYVKDYGKYHIKTIDGFPPFWWI